MRTSQALGLALLLTLLVGCAPPAAAPTPSPLPTPETTTPPPTPTPTPVPPGPLVVTLTLWAPEEMDPRGQGPEAALLAGQLADFGQAYPYVQVEVLVKKAHGRGGLFDLIRTASVAAPSVLPDLIVLSVDDLRVASLGGLVQPLDALLPAALTADRFPFAASLGEVDGKTMGIPLAVELEHLVYRPDLLAEPPITWTQVISAAAGFVFPAAAQAVENSVTLAQYLGAGGSLTDEAGMARLQVEPLTAVLGFYAQTAAAGVVSPTVVLAITETARCWDLFENGQAGIAVVDAHRFLLDADPAAAPAPLPTANGRGISLAQGWMLALVTADPQRQQQAAALIVWLLAPQRHGAWTQSAGYLPATRGGLAEWAISEEERMALEAILDSAQAEPPAALRALVGPPLQAAVEAVLRGRRSPGDAAAEAVSAVGP